MSFSTMGLIIRACTRKFTSRPYSKNALTKWATGRTIYQGLKGRDLITFDGYTKNDIFSLLWVASELKQSQEPTLSLCRGKRISLIWSNPIIKGSVSNACQRLNVSLSSIHKDQVEMSSKHQEMLGRCMGATSDIIFVDAPSWSHDSVQSLAAGCSNPVLLISSNEFSPVLAYSEMLTLFEKYGFLRRLIIAYIGPGSNPMLNTYFILLPTIGVHLRYLAYGTIDSQLTWEKGLRLSSRNGTEMKQFENIYDVLYRSHCISTCSDDMHNMHTTVPCVNTKNVKEMDLDWALLQHDSHQGLRVSEDFLKAKDHNLIFRFIENQTWIVQALILAHSSDYTPRALPPRFEGVD